MLKLKFVMTNTSIARNRLYLSSQHLSANRCSSTVSSISGVSSGTKYTSDFKHFAVENKKILSYFHDVPLDLDTQSKEANMIVEIPRWSNAKFEISHGVGNPIQQDIKNGSVRFVKNLFPNKGYIHNYGAFPQTWEDPTSKHNGLNLFGDNDPLDVCDIGCSVLKTGDIKRVKILGSLALIDDGELDWKIIVINVTDPLSKDLHDIHDVFSQCPGLLETTRQWFRDYKLPDGKPANKFAFNAVYKNQQETLEIIQQCAESWRKLITGAIKADNLPLIVNTSLPGTPGYTDVFATDLSPHNADAVLPDEVDRSYYLSSN